MTACGACLASVVVAKRSELLYPLAAAAYSLICATLATAGYMVCTALVAHAVVKMAYVGQVAADSPAAGTQRPQPLVPRGPLLQLLGRTGAAAGGADGRRERRQSFAVVGCLLALVALVQAGRERGVDAQGAGEVEGFPSLAGSVLLIGQSLAAITRALAWLFAYLCVHGAAYSLLAVMALAVWDKATQSTR